jgi:hypothetical protein
MHQGEFARVAEAWRQMGGWLTSRNCRWVGEEYYTREVPATTSRACPATARVQAAGMALGPASLWAAGRSIGGWVAAMLEGRHRATLLTERALEKCPNRSALRVV